MILTVSFKESDKRINTEFKETYRVIPEGYLRPTGTLTITDNGYHEVREFESVNVEVPIPEGYIVPDGVLKVYDVGNYDVTTYAKASFSVPTEEKTFTPTKKVQEYTPEMGYITKVVVKPIPEEYIIPEGTLAITENGEYNVTNKESVNVNVSVSEDDMLQTRVNVTKSCDYLFYNYSEANVDFIKNLDTSNVTSMKDMFRTCKKLTTIPLLNTSSVTNMNNMFYGCTALTTIPQLDVSKVTSIANIFKQCTSLKSILMYGMKVDFDISASTQFETEDLVTILNNLTTVTVTRTLTMGVTNLAKLSDEQKLIATNKGWTLA